MPQQRIEPLRCLEILDQAVSQLKLSRDEHDLCQTATRTLGEVMKDYTRLKDAENAAVAATAESEKSAPQELVEQAG